MSELPVNAFGRNPDVGAIVYEVLAAFPSARVAQREDLWEIQVALPPGSPTTTTINVATTMLVGSRGDEYRTGMLRYLEASGLSGPGLATAVDLVPQLRVAVAIIGPDDPGPEVVVAIDELADAIAGWADGFVLSMGHGELRGPDGELWAVEGGTGEDDEVVGPGAAGAARGPGDAAAVVDPVVEGGEVDIPVASIDVAAQAGDLGAGVVLVDLPEHLDVPPPAPAPPSVARVVARLLVLVGVSARAFAEESGEHLEEARVGVVDWCEELGIGGELEDHERAIVDAEIQTLDETDLVNASWGSEAAAVLAWSLGLVDLPPHDLPMEPGVLYDAVGFPEPTDALDTLSAIRLRSPEEIATLRRRLFAIHWRLTEFRLRPGAKDFAAVAADASFGPLDVEGLTLVDGDLAVDGRALATADPERVGLAQSIALERHRAVNWLTDGGRYSATDTST